MSGDIIDSNDADYIKRRIRETYLGNTSVTIVMIGKCTWARKFVDWEMASSLRDNPTAGRSGLFGITLHSAANYSSKKSPDRLNDNLMDNASPGYAEVEEVPHLGRRPRRVDRGCFQRQDRAGEPGRQQQEPVRS